MKLNAIGVHVRSRSVNRWKFGWEAFIAFHFAKSGRILIVSIDTEVCLLRASIRPGMLVILVDVYDRGDSGLRSIVLLYWCREIGEGKLQFWRFTSSRVTCSIQRAKKRNGPRKDIWNDSVSSLWGEEPINGDVDAMHMMVCTCVCDKSYRDSCNVSLTGVSD